jgi:hypothetical protein
MSSGHVLRGQRFLLLFLPAFLPPLRLADSPRLKSRPPPSEILGQSFFPETAIHFRQSW